MDLITLIVTILVIAVTSAGAFVYSRKYVKSRVKFQIIEDKLLSPIELLDQLLDQGKLDEALDVCNTYNLNSDPVYQQLWLSNEFTATTVDEYLAKVTDKTWVLDECLNRVPNDMEVTRTLLNYACNLTDYKSIIEARTEPDEPYLPSDASELLPFDATKFDESQVNLIQIRLRTLNYLDRLNTFQHLLDGVESNFVGTEFIEFRDKSIVDSAIDFARSSRFHEISVLLKWHGDQIWPHRLSILNEIPEVSSPYRYEELLRECSVDCESPWDQETPREKDWSEIIFSPLNNQYMNPISSSDSPVTTSASIAVSDNLSVESSTGASAVASISREKLTSWYIKRAKEIEKLTGLVDDCLLLLKYGLQSNLLSLHPLHDDIEHYARLLYECLSRSNETIYISYSDFKLFTIDKIVDSLALSVNSASNFISCVNKYIKPYLNYILTGLHSDCTSEYICAVNLMKVGDNMSEEEAKESAIKAIEKEINLLEALCLVALKFTDINNVILPCDVRWTTSETLPLILQRSASAYKYVDVLCKVIELTTGDKCSLEHVVTACTDRAIESNDLNVAGDYVDQLIKMNSVNAWRIAYRLGNNNSIVKKDKRLKWLAYSLIYCDESKLLHILDKIDKLRYNNYSKETSGTKRNTDHLTTWFSSNLPVNVPLTAPTNLIQSSRSVISKTAQSLATLFRSGVHEDEMHSKQRVHEENYNIYGKKYSTGSDFTGETKLYSLDTIDDKNFGQQEQQVCQVNDCNTSTRTRESTTAVASPFFTSTCTHDRHVSTSCVDVTTDQHVNQFNSMYDGTQNIRNCKERSPDITRVSAQSRDDVTFAGQNEHRKLQSTVSDIENSVNRGDISRTDTGQSDSQPEDADENATWDGWE